MPKGLRYENDFLVGGPASVWATPNFRLSEFAGADGKARLSYTLIPPK